MKKKIFFLWACALCAASVSAKTIYLNAGGNTLWDQGGAVFFAHSWSGESYADAQMGLVTTGVYSAEIPDQNNSILFVRMPNGSTSLNWETKWNQTEDMTIPSDKDCYTITGWGEGEGAKSVGTWSTYSGPTTMDYYLAGSGFPNATWEAGQHLPMTNGTISLTGLAAGIYRFKVTNNTWDVSLGYAAVDASCSTPGYNSDEDANIVVKLAGTGDITIAVNAGLICITIVGETVEIPASSVPSECGDVMMQGFYWDSYMPNDAEKGTDLYGDTRWKTLLGQADEIGAYFDLIWLPPSAYASGTGYHPRQYSNQNSDWGSRAELEKLISTFHNSGTRVVADMVVNHLEAMSSWCDFAVQDFGEYGRFAPDGSWICKDDEMNDAANATEAGECYGTATGAYDDGYGSEKNYAAARDLAHDQDNVREMIRAYAQWLINVMHYDGFRYDYCKGFHASHINDYNKAGGAYISFMEMWSGNDEIIRNIQDAQMNTMALDFQTKYSAFDGIAGFDYSRCKASGLLGAGYSKYAVTFIDSHDWFLRDNGQEFGGNGNSMKEELKDRLLQANAFLLSMPGVPSVFYPHWAKYKEELKPMIDARHLAGVHSESVVSDETAEHDGYQCTVRGKNGYLILCLGNKAPGSFSGFRKMASGNGYAIWVKAEGDAAPGLMVTPSTTFEDAEQGMQVTMEAVGGSGNAKIYYTTDGTEPTTSSAEYTAPLLIKTTTTLKVIAVCGSAQSKVQTYTYTYREPLKHGIRVRFNKPEEWSKVYIYAWLPGTDTQGNPTSENIVGAYPGQRIYQDADGWYSYEFDNTMKKVNFCINSGDECGGVNVRSNDLEIDYDACFGWREGKETESSEEVVLDCDTMLQPPFDLVISPESGFFRDMNEGQQVTIRAIGAENAMIYYTTDGSEPTTASQSAQGQAVLTVKQTTTVKAYAALDKERTETYTATYTYRAPQQGALKVKFIKPEAWADLYLYAFTRVKVGSKYKDTPYALDGQNAKWPGMKWTSKEGEWYTHTMNADVKEIYVIFTEGDKKPQSQDIYLDEDACYVWNSDCGKAVRDMDCDGQLQAIEQAETEWPKPDYSRPMYNVLGQRVSEGYQGVIIQNGHKYLIH
ncbi:MAG: chitobiase/beta-hexosaminidase C-terminal domain-containing protein [Paludibacteraceae bacterium]|nr:chitobiase/beta-hexosaminidase C-terminal domain-containing protein [Paludibacteraceae bacterium]